MRILTIDLCERTPSGVHSVIRKVATTYVVEHDTAQGLLRCREGSYTVAVLCVDRSGPAENEFAADLRGGDTQIPLLVVAGRSSTDDMISALDSGADDYLPGDRPAAELAARLRALGRREPHVTPGRTVNGEIVLDSSAHRVWHRDAELRLTRLQFALLETLLRHRGRALSRAQLLELVWDPTSEVSSNVVDQAVAALRREIGIDLIATVRGVGYRLEAA